MEWAGEVFHGGATALDQPHAGILTHPLKPQTEGGS
jgi:hypothetical protein